MRSLVLVALAIGCGGCAASLVPKATLDSIHGRGADRQLVVTVRNAPVNASSFAGSTVKGYDAASRYAASPAALRNAAALALQYRLRAVTAWPIEVLEVYCLVFEAPEDRPLESILAELRRDARVESAQLLQTFGTRSRQPYDDTYVALQTNLAALQIQQAHRWSQGQGVRVAVIDSGIDTHHPDLADRIAVDIDATGLPRGSGGRDLHGLAVAGVIAATAGNGQGIVGVAPAAKILALRACWQVDAARERQAESRCNTFTLARALAAAIEHRADIINLSLTGPHDPLLERLLRKAMASGKVVVSALPEDDGSPERPQGDFPASLQGVLAVRSAEAPSSTSSSANALVAPGRHILTLRPRNGYDFENGSSFAAAQVSGVAALLMSLRNDLSTERIRELLVGPAEPTPPDLAGSSLVNACTAVANLIRQDCLPDRERHANSLKPASP